MAVSHKWRAPSGFIFQKTRSLVMHWTLNNADQLSFGDARPIIVLIGTTYLPCSHKAAICPHRVCVCLLMMLRGPNGLHPTKTPCTGTRVGRCPEFLLPRLAAWSRSVA